MSFATSVSRFAGDVTVEAERRTRSASDMRGFTSVVGGGGRTN